MITISEIVKNLFVAEGKGTFATETNWSLYLGAEPLTPLNVVTIYDTAGSGPEAFYTRAENPVENPSIQIRVRGEDKSEVHDKIRELGKVLELKEAHTVSDTKILSFIRTSNYLDLGIIRDSDLLAYLYTVNFTVKNQKTI